MRWCRKCDRDLPPEAFYKRPATVCKKCHKARMLVYYNTPEYRAKNAEYQKTRLAADENYAKHAARTALGYALRKGRVAKADFCTICGSDKEIEGHHEDHSKPLEVVWLCRNCHVKYHADQAAIQSSLKPKAMSKSGVSPPNNHNIHYKTRQKTDKLPNRVM